MGATPGISPVIGLIAVGYSQGPEFLRHMSQRTAIDQPDVALLVDNASQIEDANDRRVLNVGHNLGFGTGLNAGFNEVRKHTPALTHVLLTNDDLEFPPGFFSHLWSELERTNYQGPTVLAQHANGDVPLTVVPSILAGFVLAIVGQTGAVRCPGVQTSPGGAGIVIGVKAFADVDGFDPEFFLYFEETDLLQRLAKQGFPWDRTPIRPMHIEHAGAVSTNSVRDFCDQEYARSTRHYLSKHSKPGEMSIRLAIVSYGLGMLSNRLIHSGFGLLRRPQVSRAKYLLREALTPLGDVSDSSTVAPAPRAIRLQFGTLREVG